MSARPLPDRRPLLVVVVAVAVVAAVSILAAALLGSVLHAPRRGAELRARPEGHLYYPGAIVLDATQQDEVDHLMIEPSSGATSSAELATSATRSDVLAWYGQQLTSRGWRSTDSGGAADGSWMRGAGEWYTLTFGGPLHPGAQPPPPQSTVFQVTYGVLPGH